MIIEKLETVRAVRSRQIMWLDWHQNATAGLTDDDLVITVTRQTPFGNYLTEMVRP